MVARRYAEGKIHLGREDGKMFQQYGEQSEELEKAIKNYMEDKMETGEILEY